MFLSVNNAFLINKTIPSLFISLYIISGISSGICKELAFDPDFLSLSDGEEGKKIDLSYFSKEGGMLPGVYRVAVYVNNEKVDFTSLNFISRNNNSGELSPCVSKADLLKWGVNTSLSSDDNCIVLSSKQPFIVKESLDLNKMEYHIVVPQADILTNGWLRTKPEQWQNGLTALLVNYSLSGSKQGIFISDGNDYNSNYLGVDSLLNLSGWRLYNSSNWQESNGISQFSSTRTYVKRSYGFAQGGELTIGDNYIDSDFFDSFQFRGVKLESDDGMLFPELSDYTPVIRGVAYSQARVTVKQLGQVIYERNVPPGPFELNDLSSYTGGDLDITVREADGSERHYTQSSAHLPILQREGRLKYSLSTGKYDSNTQSDSPLFIGVTGAYGLPNEYTLYGGSILSSAYRSLLFGVGKYDVTLGALSFDATVADINLKLSNNDYVKRNNGQSYRLSYSRGFNSGTSLNIASYRYSSKGFYTFQDAMNQYYENNTDYFNRMRSRFLLSISQSIGSIGQFSISGTQDSYWNTPETGSSWMANWYNSFGIASVNISLGYTSSVRYKDDKSSSLSISIPLSSLVSRSNLNFNNTTATLNGIVTNQSTITGSSSDSSLNWGVSNSLGREDYTTSQSVNMSWDSGKGLLSSGYSHYKNNDMINYGVRGGVVIHASGITLSPPLYLNSGSALVDVTGVSDIPIKNGIAIKTDSFGYAVVPNLTAFQKNNISLDVDNFKNSDESIDTDKTVIPARGALVPIKFDVQSGQRALITLRYKGSYLPLGAFININSSKKQKTGIVDENGQVYLSGLPKEGVIEATWNNMACRAPYNFASDKFHKISLDCI